jgi:hypothetical protein
MMNHRSVIVIHTKPQSDHERKSNLTANAHFSCVFPPPRINGANDGQGWELARLAQLRVAFLDLTVDRKAAGAGLGEDFPAVDDHVELTGLTRVDLDVFTEAGFEQSRQTGGPWPIVSSSAVQNFGGHC